MVRRVAICFAGMLGGALFASMSPWILSNMSDPLTPEELQLTLAWLVFQVLLVSGASLFLLVASLKASPEERGNPKMRLLLVAISGFAASYLVSKVAWIVYFVLWLA